MSDEKDKRGTADTESSLLKDTMEVYNKSILGKKDAEFNFKLICEWLLKHKDDSPETMTESALAEAQKESNTLMSRLRISVEALRKLDEEYEAMRQRVNTYYKKEILLPHPPSPTWEEMMREADNDDDGEQWKKG